MLDTQTYEVEATVVSLNLQSWNDMTFAVSSYSDWNNDTFFGFWFDDNNSEALELDMWNMAQTKITSSSTYYIHVATLKSPKLECHTKTACSTVECR
jgi:hypothetical protein